MRKISILSLLQLKVRTEAGHKSFLFQGSKLCSKLSKVLKRERSLVIFKDYVMHLTGMFKLLFLLLKLVITYFIFYFHFLIFIFIFSFSFPFT